MRFLSVISYFCVSASAALALRWAMARSLKLFESSLTLSNGRTNRLDDPVARSALFGESGVAGIGSRVTLDFFSGTQGGPL
jgi:hypothetical protein